LVLQEHISTSSENLFNVMGMGVDKLLENKHLEVFIFKNFNESLKNYLVARVELDRALGGYLSRLQKECQGEVE
jgi:cobalt-zinc-cadmium efflux system outer membrane protein